LQLFLWRHGLWLPVCAAVLAAAAVAGLQARSLRIAAAQPALVEAVPRANQAPVADDAAAADAAAWEAWRAVLEPYDNATAGVRRLVSLTQADLAWQRAEFQQQDDPALGVVRMTIEVPVSGQYRRLRKALDAALREMPALSLDRVTLRREAAAESELDARLRFSLWLERPAGGAR
jgi:hypothetical protein